LWDPTKKITCKEIEHVQKQAVKFIANLKGRYSISVLQHKSLSSWGKDNRLTLLVSILSFEDHYKILSAAYNELSNSN